MIYPKHNRFYKLFFDFYTASIIRSDFKNFIIEGTADAINDKPLLVIANHFSWWDGFFHYHLNNLIFKKRYHVMMLEEQLEKRMFLTRLGIFGVKKGSKEALTSLKFAAELLSDDKNMVLIFPQGKIESQHQHEFTFESGVNKLIKQRDQISVVFAVSLVDYFSDRKPVARFYLNKPELTDGYNMEREFNTFYQKCLEKQKKKED